MKARVKATGNTVEVFECGTIFKHAGYDYMDAEGNSYKSTDLDFNDNTPLNYWDRLLHQYAGMAMQGILSNEDYLQSFAEDARGNLFEDIARVAEEIAHALVEKMKEKEE